METNVYDYLPQKCLCSDHKRRALGIGILPEQKYENPDGTPIVFDMDSSEYRQGINPLPGPFASKRLRMMHFYA